MNSLDSLASIFGNQNVNYVFATEMNERYANSFLERDHQAYKNFSVIGEMDNFISGLYNSKQIYLPKSKFYHYDLVSKKSTEVKDPIPQKSKRKPFYILMDSKGNILYYNKKLYFNVLYDSVLVNMLKNYSTVKNTQIRN